MLRVNMSGFHLDSDTLVSSLPASALGFSIDKTVSDTMNPYIENEDFSCILNKSLEEKEAAGIIRFILDFDKKVTLVKLSDNLKSITILEKEKEQATGGALSDEGLFNRPKRDSADNYEKRNMKDSDEINIFGSDVQREIVKYDKQVEEDEKMKQLTSTDKKAEEIKQADPVREEVKSKDTLNESVKEEPAKEGVKPRVTKTKTGLHPGPVHAHAPPKTPEPTDAPITIPLKVDKDGHYETSFYIYIMNEKLEGLYSMFFHNCLNYPRNIASSAKHRKESVTFTVEIEEKNSDR